MLAMLGSIAAEGAAQDPEAEARMNLAIAKFIGIDFITKSILMDQGFDEVAAAKMASALLNSEEGGEKTQISVLTSLGLSEEQAAQVSALFRI